MAVFPKTAALSGGGVVGRAAGAERAAAGAKSERDRAFVALGLRGENLEIFLIGVFADFLSIGVLADFLEIFLIGGLADFLSIGVLADYLSRAFTNLHLSLMESKQF
jgi:hypothetical protein